MGLFNQFDSPLRESVDRDADGNEIKVTEQSVKVTTIEDDRGVTTATYNSISNSLYDLADSNSKTSTVILPNGTTIKLAATSRPGLGSYRATFEVAAKNGEPQTVYGSTAAADLAHKLDILALSPKQKAALQRLSESELLAMAAGHLQEVKVNVSGYVTKRGRHVGAYTQIRKAIAKISSGGAAHFPDGITVKQGSGGYEVYGGGGDGTPEVSRASSPEAAASAVAIRSAGSDHPKSLGGKKRHRSTAFGAAIQGNTKKRMDELPADNPKLPGTPHPEAVADKAAKARKAAKLPSRKERAENERKASRDQQERRAGATADAEGRYGSTASRIQRLKDARASTQQSLDEMRKRPGAREQAIRDLEDQLQQYDAELKRLRGKNDEMSREAATRSLIGR